MEFELSRDELGFDLVDTSDGTFFVRGVRVTATGGWLLALFPRDPPGMPETMPLRVRAAGRGTIRVRLPADEHVSAMDRDSMRLAVVVALQSELMRRCWRAHAMPGS